MIRAFELPLQGCTPEVFPLLRECWKQATMLANWGCHQLVRLDCVRTPDMLSSDDFPDPPKVYMYGLFTGLEANKKGEKRKKKPKRISPGYPGQEFFEGAKDSANAILNRVQKDWNNDRWDVLWRRTRSPRSYRNTPFPTRSWKPFIGEDGRPSVEATLPGGRVVINLRGGEEFAPQMALFRKVVSGDLPRKEIVFYPQRCSDSCHRPTIQIDGVPHRIMCKMIADIPPREKPGDRCLTLITDPNSFWVAELDGRQAWVLNNDHWRRVVSRHDEHLRILQRMSQDAKAERRMTNNRSDVQIPRLEALCHKDRNRLDSFTHEASANLVNFAIRQKVGEIFYLDRDRGFIPKFPWHELHLKLADKCAANGIAFYSESSLRSSSADSTITDDTPEADIRPAEEDEKWTRIARLREMATGRLVRAKRRKGSHPEVTPSAP